MSFIGYLLSLLLTGLIVGGLARLALPGRDPMSIPMTILLGIAGSFIGGLIYRAITDGDSPLLGLLFAVLAGVGLVYLVRRTRQGSGGHAAATRHR